MAELKPTRHKWISLIHVFLITVAVAVIGLIAFYSQEVQFSSTMPTETLVACPIFPGRLGNHIYHYASVFGLAKLYNLTILLDKNDDIVKYFKVPSGKRINNRAAKCRQYPYMEDKLCCTFDPSLVQLSRKSYRFGKYLQSWKYFKDVFTEVKSELEFKDDIKQSAIYIVENYRSVYQLTHNIQNVVTIGIHIRRGDTMRPKLKSSIFVPDEYFYHAIDYALDKYQNVVFIVCSDDIEYAKQLVEFKNVTAHFAYISPIQDLAILAQCDHVIIGYGTFGWWAGFLSGGEVIYYTYPINEAAGIRLCYNYDDFYPANWTALE